MSITSQSGVTYHIMNTINAICEVMHGALGRYY